MTAFCTSPSGFITREINFTQVTASMVLVASPSLMPVQAYLLLIDNMTGRASQLFRGMAVFNLRGMQQRRLAVP
jgi:hypothetical protein